MSSRTTPARRGLFFSFEGIDGSGKSTQARLLAAALSEAGHQVVMVREPGGTALGEQIRALLLDPASDITPRAEALLFAAARAQLVEGVIEPALSAGHHVVADRYVDSTTAYQGAGRGLGASLDAVSAFATEGRMPDRTYLVTVSLQISSARRARRDADRMENPSDAFRQRVAEAYQTTASQFPDRMLVVEGTGPEADVHRQILDDAVEIIASR
ncbi:MAG TPA: dTMP kinase [Rubricoccaceae bacterium]|jgi:dTMP kinase